MNKVFLDSNILIYLYSSDEPEKVSTIKTLLQEHRHAFISTQVLVDGALHIINPFSTQTA